MAIQEITELSTPQRTMGSFLLLPKTNNANPTTPSSPTFSESLMRENMKNSEAVIRKWDPSNHSMESIVVLFHENRKEAKEFITCVKDLRKAMHFLISEHASSDQLVLANKLMKIAMKRLEKEFFQILSTNREYLNPESVSSGSSRLSRSLSFGNSEDDDEYNHGDDSPMSKAERAMSDLKLIAETMISSGYGKECLKIYKITRKSILDQELYRLGLKTHSSTHVINQMGCESFEHQIDKWIHTAKIAIRSLFRGERSLCDHVFSSSETIKQACISHITIEGATKLFKFPELVAKSKRSPERIFPLMNMHETISDLWPDIDSVFAYESLSDIRVQALSSLHKLRDCIQTILSEYVSSVQKNSSKTTIPGGGIHPLTCSVMDYVSSLADNSGALAEILAEDQETISTARSPFPESYFNSSAPNSSVASRLAWIILVLLCKLDSKSKLYNNVALSYIFLANNLKFVIEKASTTALKLILGEEWLSKLQKKVKLYAANYESVAWGKALSCLPAENVVAGMSPATITKCFRQFNSIFEDEYRKQRSWVVPDSKLRDEIKVSIARKLVPAYREFYDSYMTVLRKESNDFEVLARFSPDNLGNYLSDLFHDTAVFVHSSSSTQSRMSRCL
ncbi:protein binding protein [Dorcoceras hygrometricum]|uniref:Exocyst subunit Exo70 family protein n=1 Tax=Dorcoceras hygrometricum TaxID=472368 RepID=A0A2Z7AUZ1_9LAMI|nr:protein binding protein [Dorcoceras hygrometricum]